MTVTVMRDTIECPGCGDRRSVTARQARRSVSTGGIRCSTCRGVGDTRAYTDDDLRFWLRRFGSPCPRGVDPRAYIVAGGAAPELVELAKEVYGRPEAL